MNREVSPQYYQPKTQSTLGFILKALIPYSRQNILLVFDSGHFFNELEKMSKVKKRALEQAAARAIKRGLVEKTKSRQLKLTELGKRFALPYTAKLLSRNGRLMVIFDIPEEQATARKQFRRLLKKWGFEQVQKSVWLSQYNHTESIKLAVEELELDTYVKLYECIPLPLE